MSCLKKKGFNQTVLYGRDVSVEDIISTANHPMMAERQVVIVKEAQDLSRTIEAGKLCRKSNAFYRFGDLL
jgi:hypothetical protein